MKESERREVMAESLYLSWDNRKKIKEKYMVLTEVTIGKNYGRTALLLLLSIVGENKMI